MATQKSLQAANQRMVIDLSGRKGLSAKWGGDINNFGITGNLPVGQPNLRYLAADGTMVGGTYNPISKYGYLSPSQNSSIDVLQTGFSFALAHEVSVSLVDPHQNRMFFFSTNEKMIMEGTYGVTGWTEKYPGSVVTTFVTDAANYYLNGVPTYFVATISNTPANVIMTYDGGTLNEDWSSTDVSGAFAMNSGYAFKLIPSGDGYMYILNQNAVHILDGTVIGGANGTILKNQLLAPSGTFLTHGIEYNNYLYIAVQNNTTWENFTNPTMFQTLSAASGQVGIYVWNKQASFANSSNFINITGVDHLRAMFVTSKNELCVICVLPDGQAQVLQFDGTKFVVVENLPFGAFPMHQSGLQVYGNFTYWLGLDGNIYSYGSENTDSANLLTVFGQYATGGIGAAGGVAMAIVSSPLFVSGGGKPSSDMMYVFGKTASSTYVCKTFPMFPTNTITINSVTYNIQQHQGNIYTPVKILPTLCNVRHINVFMAPYPALTGTQKEAAIEFYFNGSTAVGMTKYVTRSDIAKGYVSYEINKPYINSIQMKIRYFNASNLNPEGLYSNIGVADFSPSFAELFYEPTTTLR